MKKIIIAGGTGFLGQTLSRYFSNIGYEIVILTRQNVSCNSSNIRYVKWDAATVGEWAAELESAKALINLNGKSVDCRYTNKNKALIYSTRLDSTAVLGEAVNRCKIPPKFWANAASATIYRHSVDKEMDEQNGEIGTGFSIDVCQKWEAMFNSIATPLTRKVLLRTSIVLGKNGGALTPLKLLAKAGMGGMQGYGNQYMSWLHENDFASIVDFLIHHDECGGAYNVTSPVPIPNKEFMSVLRKSVGAKIGIPIPAWLLIPGAFLIRTEPELILKSRRVVPGRLTDAGYHFLFSDLGSALKDLGQN